MRQRFILKRVDPLSAAKIAGLLYGLFGILMGAIFSIAFLIGGSAALATGGQPPPPFLGILFGAGSIIFFPVFYGAIGFISALIGCWLYNWLARVVGGVQWELLAVSPAVIPGAAPVPLPPDVPVT